MALLDILNNPSYSNSVISPLFEDCKQLTIQIPHLSIIHSYREGNRCANHLASLGLGQSLDFVIHHYPPMDLLPFVEANCQGMYFNRLCPNLLFSR